MRAKLKVSAPNQKLRKLCKAAGIAPNLCGSIALSSGYSCPWASDCLSKAVPTATGGLTVVDAPGCQYRCFMASREAQYRNTYLAHMHNFEALLACGNESARMADLCLSSILEKLQVFRWNTGGDVFSAAYLRAIIKVATLRPQTQFYLYTKSLHLLVTMRLRADSLPPNLNLTLSKGSRFPQHEALLASMGHRFAHVVYSRKQASDMRLPIDETDEIAAFGRGDFALLVHGTQPVGSDAGKAVQALKAEAS